MTAAAHRALPVAPEIRAFARRRARASRALGRRVCSWGCRGGVLALTAEPCRPLPGAPGAGVGERPGQQPRHAGTAWGLPPAVTAVTGSEWGEGAATRPESDQAFSWAQFPPRGCKPAPGPAAGAALSQSKHPKASAPLQARVLRLSFKEQVLDDVRLDSHQDGSRPALETEGQHSPVPRSPTGTCCVGLLEAPAAPGPTASVGGRVLCSRWELSSF